MYNGDKYGDVCPICGVVAKKSKEDGKSKEEIEAMLKIPKDRYACGWLVCIEGLNKGLSYPIHPGKNFVGGSDGMDIQILGDENVNPYRHAILAYDSKRRKTTLLPGESAGLVYLEGESVYTPQDLSPFARVELGNSTFLFISFCGDQYNWE